MLPVSAFTLTTFGHETLVREAVRVQSPRLTMPTPETPELEPEAPLEEPPVKEIGFGERLEQELSRPGAGEFYTQARELAPPALPMDLAAPNAAPSYAVCRVHSTAVRHAGHRLPVAGGALYGGPHSLPRGQQLPPHG